MDENVYLSIRDAITNGEFGPGESLTEELLSKRFSVSRTPIREVLIRLQSEGLVTIIRNKGAFVKNITIKDIIEIFQMRILLEGYATSSCIDRIDINEVKKLKFQMIELKDKQNSSEDMSELGVSLHNMIRDCCGNSRLNGFISTIESQILWVRSFAFRIPGRSEKSAWDHVSIAQAIIDGDKDKAKKKMRLHLKNTLEEILKVENQIYTFDLP